MSDEEALAALSVRMRAALDGLPMTQRAVYLLSSLDGFPHEAIAFRMGLGTGEVETILGAAIAAIEPCLRQGISH